MRKVDVESKHVESEHEAENANIVYFIEGGSPIAFGPLTQASANKQAHIMRGVLSPGKYLHLPTREVALIKLLQSNSNPLLS